MDKIIEELDFTALNAEFTAGIGRRIDIRE